MRLRVLAPEQYIGSLSKRTEGVFYGWWLVGVAVFMLTLMSLTVFQGLGTFLVALQNHFGWSRTQLSGAFSLARAEGAVLGPIEGFLVDRVGTRRMVLIGYSILGTGFVLFSFVQTLWQFYLVFMLITLGSGLGGWLAMIGMVNHWFSRRRAFAMALAMSGIHVAGFLVPVLAFGIESHGFRMTTLGIGIFILAAVFPVTRLIRNRPEEYGLLPDGDAPATQPAQKAAATVVARADDDAAFTARQALRTRAFWVLTVAQLSSSVSIVTLALHLVPKLTDMELSLKMASTVVLTYTAIALPAQFVVGRIADRLPKPPVIFACMTFQAVSLVVIALAESLYLAFLFAVLYGIGFGGRTPVMTALRGEYFGRKAFASIMGLSQFPNNIAMIGAPLFAGYMFDTTGTYLVPFMTFAALSFMGALLMLTVRKPKAAAA
jgi:MFS family permease